MLNTFHMESSALACARPHTVRRGRPRVGTGWRTLARLMGVCVALGLTCSSWADAQEAPLRARIVVDGQVSPIYESDDFATVFNQVVHNDSRLIEVFGTPRFSSTITVTRSLDLSNHRQGTIFNFSGIRLEAHMAGGVVLDMTRTTGATVTGLQLVVPAAAGMPDVGLLQSRDAEASRASGKNRFYDIAISGHFTIAPMYNIGAEASEHFGVRLDQTNPTGVAGLYLARHNEHGLTSAFGFTPGNTSSATGQIFHGLHIRCDAPGNRAKGLVIAGFSKVALYGTYVRTVGTAGSYLHIDVSAGSMSGLHADGFQGQGSPDYGILIDGRFGHGIVNIDLSAKQLAAAQYPIYIGPVDLVHARLTHAEVTFGFVDRAARLRGVQVQMRESGWQSLDQDPS